MPTELGNLATLLFTSETTYTLYAHVIVVFQFYASIFFITRSRESNKKITISMFLSNKNQL